MPTLLIKFKNPDTTTAQTAYGPKGHRVQTDTPLWKAVCYYLVKLSIWTHYNPAIPLPGVYPRETLMHVPEEKYTKMLTAEQFTRLETTQMSSPGE